MAQFRELYKQQAVPALQEQFGFANPMRVPKITKVVLNMGLGEAVTDKKSTRERCRGSNEDLWSESRCH
jgi:large subunit ribosomal protein L5